MQRKPQTTATHGRYRLQDSGSTQFVFSYTTQAHWQSPDEQPAQSVPQQETVPLSAFSHDASTMQAIARYLVDTRKLSFTDAARMLCRSPKSVWTSYHQASALPMLEPSLPIPLDVFTQATTPLESLVSFLQRQGLRNADIARVLRLSPKTTWTAAKRAAKRLEASA